MSSPAPHPHWMLAEIFEQPKSLSATLSRYAQADGFHQDVVAPILNWLPAQGNILIAASGSSRHAGMVGQAAIEAITALTVGVEFASEYRLRTVQASPWSAVIVISQSGETADTLAALRSASALGLPTLAITNNAGSSMSTEADVSMPVQAGQERAIPATKSFTGQLLVLELLSLLAAQKTGTLDASALTARLAALHQLPATLEAQLEPWRQLAEAAADHFKHAQSFLFLGRGIHYPIANEGALKLKESAYIHAEGYPAGELKHGPNALVSQHTPLVFLATVDPDDATSVERYEKTVQLMADMRRQGAGILAIANTGDNRAAELADICIPVTPIAESLLPLCEVIPLQFLAYYFAIGRGIDVDNPRNLVKAVVVE